MNTIPKSRLDRLIPEARRIITEVRIAEAGIVPGSYHGYISSFGADMVQSSPLAAAIFFEDSSGSQEDRSLITKAILKLMRWENGNTIPPQHEKLSDYLSTFQGHIPGKVVYDVIAASVALKIALRTFKKRENG